MTSAAKIKTIASKIGNLPTLPTIAARMIELADDPHTNIQTLAELISTDQSLTARILKSANSVYYGLAREISTVDTAIVVMGRNAVKEIGLSLSVIDAFKNIGSLNRFDIQKYWEHSVAVATEAMNIAKKQCPDKAGELYVAGLLHDIGKMILIQHVPNDFYSVLDYMEEKNVPYFEAEEEVLGITHAEIGYIIAERWNLPPNLCMTIRHHHSPDSAPKEFMTYAEIVCEANGI